LTCDKGGHPFWPNSHSSKKGEKQLSRSIKRGQSGLHRNGGGHQEKNLQAYYVRKAVQVWSTSWQGLYRVCSLFVVNTNVSVAVLKILYCFVVNASVTGDCTDNIVLFSNLLCVDLKKKKILRNYSCCVIPMKLLMCITFLYVICNDMIKQFLLFWLMITYFNQLVSGVPACTQPCSSHPPATASVQVCSLPLKKSLSSSKLAARKARYRMKKICLSCGRSIAPFFWW